MFLFKKLTVESIYQEKSLSKKVSEDLSVASVHVKGHAVVQKGHLKRKEKHQHPLHKRQ